MSNPTAAGWYDDPEHPDQLRYFDGIVWTRHTTPRATRPATTAPVVSVDAPPSTGTTPDPYGWRGGSAPTSPPAGGPPANPWGPSQPGSQWGPPQPGAQWGTYAPRPAGPATPDGVPLAGWWQRVGAYIIDALITGVLSGIFGGYFLLKALQPWIDAFSDAVRANDPEALNRLSADLSTYMTGGNFLAFVAITMVIGLAYHVGFVTKKGATPGKMALGISVRERERPGPPPVLVAMRRYALILALNVFSLVPGAIGFLLSMIGIADYLWPLWDPRKQALHDKIAGTNVVRGKAGPRR